MCMEEGLHTGGEKSFSPEGAHLICWSLYEETGLIS